MKYIIQLFVVFTAVNIIIEVPLAPIWIFVIGGVSSLICRAIEDVMK